MPGAIQTRLVEMVILYPRDCTVERFETLVKMVIHNPKDRICSGTV